MDDPQPWRRWKPSTAMGTLQTGDVFYEPANGAIARFDNASDREAAVFVACHVMRPGESRLIEMLDASGEQRR
jgi:hypothetical protein